MLLSHVAVQIEQKMATKIIEEEEKRMFHEMNEAERIKSLARVEEDKRRALELREATVRILDEQVRAVNQRKEDEMIARQQEIEELRTLWESMAREQEEQDIAERERMRQLAAEVFEFNRLRKEDMSEKERKEKELDLRILQEALSREAEDERREADAKARRMEDARKYREQLAIMMAHEAENDAEREAMIQAAFEQQQAKMDAEIAAREAARRALMEQVDAIRQEQIYYKQQERRMKYTNRDAELLALEEQDARLAEAEQRKMMDTKRRNLVQKLELQTQMVSKAHIRAAEEDEKLRALEVAKATENAYMARVQNTLATSDPPQWYGRRKIDWYS